MNWKKISLLSIFGPTSEPAQHRFWAGPFPSSSSPPGLLAGPAASLFPLSHFPRPACSFLALAARQPAYAAHCSAARSPWPSWRTGLLSSALLLRSAYAAPHARVCFLSLRRGTRSSARAPHAPASPFSLAASRDPPVGVTPPSHCAAGPTCQRLLFLSFLP